tara:strand:- start:170 stop:493 length:324 start_codon:yes stop_codon:yes gene_type:complete
MLLNHIQFVIGDTVVEHLNEEDANDLLTSTIWWMEEVECPHTLSEIDDFQESIVDRIFEFSTEVAIEDWEEELGASGEQHELFARCIWTDDQLGWLGTPYTGQRMVG